MQSYRRGRNELDSKSSCPNRHVGSNPTDCAIDRSIVKITYDLKIKLDR